MNANSQPPLSMLSGITIASFTQFLLGPAAVQYLSDMGADVVKIESPGAGAWERSWSGGGTFPNGVSAFYLLSHRNVRSLSLNLKHPDGQAAARRLVAKVDVLVENFRPGVMERFGLGYAAVREINPRIIYATASGYGSDSPHRNLPGQDLVLQAVTGLAAITGTAGQPPTPAGSAIVDQHAAALLAMGILGALLHRQRTGEGQRLEVTMVQAALDLQLEPVVYCLNGGHVERPDSGLGSGFHQAPYGIYATRDGYLAISIVPVKLIAQALGDPPELQPYMDPGLALEKREEIYRGLAPLLKDRPTHELLEILRAAGVWCAPVQNYAAVFADPVVQHVQPLLEIDHPRAGRVKLLKHPIRYGAGVPTVRRLPPDVGEQTDEVLAELAYSPDEIARLHQVGAV